MIRHLKSLRGVALALATLGPTAVLACSPIKVFYVYFDRDSAAVSADQVLRLGSWMTELRMRYPNHEAIYVGASVEPEERDHRPHGLGLERGRNVARVLRENLQFTARIDPPKTSHVVGREPSANKSVENQRALGVQLDFLPACPHECTCQMGDPLYKAPAPRHSTGASG